MGERLHGLNGCLAAVLKGKYSGSAYRTSDGCAFFSDNSTKRTDDQGNSYFAKAGSPRSNTQVAERYWETAFHFNSRPDLIKPSTVPVASAAMSYILGLEPGKVDSEYVLFRFRDDES